MYFTVFLNKDDDNDDDEEEEEEQQQQQEEVGEGGGGVKTLNSENHKFTKSLNLICKLVLIMKVIFTYTYLYFIPVFSLPTSWNVVRIPICVVRGAISKYGLSPRERMQFGKNPEFSTVTFFLWVIKKSVKLCQEVELVWNYYFWMRVQNGANKTVATPRITNKQHK